LLCSAAASSAATSKPWMKACEGERERGRNSTTTFLFQMRVEAAAAVAAHVDHILCLSRHMRCRLTAP
jgi:hypothetical protein